MMDDQLLRTIEDKIDIVELVSETTDLVRKGNRYWGLCPFHSEKTPSFTVSAEKRLFYCFGCHVGGNIFTFLMKRDNLTFKEAVEVLAARAGVEYVSKSVGSERKKPDEEIILKVNELAALFYHEQLKSEKGVKARKYLEERGVDWETAVAFQLGYAPDDWRQLMDHLVSRGYSGAQLAASGLIKKSQARGSYYDAFRDRLVFPIRNRFGSVVGMGGRSLSPADSPKYLNSAETAVFSKRDNLYGLFEAWEHIRRLNEAILVEGYMDCITLHQHGIRQAVASLGTALTAEQARLLRRYTERVVLVYDGDLAGRTQAVRAAGVLENEGLTVEVVVLPDEQDPDQYIREKGKEEFLQYIKNNKKNPVEFKIELRLRGVEGQNLGAKLAMLHQSFGDLQRVTSPLELESYLNLIARKVQLPEAAVIKEFRAWQGKNKVIGIIRNRNSTNRYNKGDKERLWSTGFQTRLLARMINDERVFRFVTDNCGTGFVNDPKLRKMVDLIREKGTGDYSASLLNELAENSPEMASVLARIEMVGEEHWPSDYEIEKFVKAVKNRRIEGKWLALLKEIENQKNKGDFYDIIRLILKADRYLNLQEGGEL